MTRTLPNLSKLEPLDETNYKCWSQKLLIFFEQLDVDYVLFQNPPETPLEASVLAITLVDTSTVGTTKSENEAKQKKLGHKAYQCYQRKDQRKGNQNPTTQPTPQSNLAEKDEIIVAAVVEANLVENKNDWVLDTGASRHFCSNKVLFHELVDVADDECVFIGNSTTTGVLGKGKVFPKLTS
ncbi:UNVERIFIED_CONTAM: hypothetical protein Sangu_3153100 [Sesamum angustifolium]|uniref:Retrovirus-related Pol polyprotein from transposon TNT 1-94-like beta-barrel domain-containing protein n=1 Tax=Sesamum angustifolium TaxID=2727405 RepID=A0AAW2JUA2_9LAMI